MDERLKVKVAVFLVLEKNGKYLFGKRENTGYKDGFYTLPSGHVEPGESLRKAMIREAKEEVSIILDEGDLHFVHAMYNKDRYADFYFSASAWSGEPVNNEPEKCSEIVWAEVDELEGHVVEKVRAALKSIESEVHISELDLM